MHKKSHFIQDSSDRRLFNLLGYIFVTAMVLLCFVPFLVILSGSFSSSEAIAKNGFSLFIQDFSLDAYRLAFQNPVKILRAYKVTILVTAAGTLLHLMIASMAGYALSRKDFRSRNGFSFFLFLTTIFGGGLVPWYILCVRYLQFKSHPYLAMILPGLFSYFNIIIVRSFMSGIPDAIGESAKIDGANDFVVFWKLILPLAKPALATIGLFTALSYWNDWYNEMLFVKDSNYFNLQYYLYQTLNSTKEIQNSLATVTTSKLPPTEPFKLAMTVVTIGPVVLVYPFLQKYFIKGITIGAVKG